MKRCVFYIFFFTLYIGFSFSPLFFSNSFSISRLQIRLNLIPIISVLLLLLLLLLLNAQTNKLQHDALFPLFNMVVSGQSDPHDLNMQK
jgi:energy-coupling factor transporter transmembrane protein EcfT